MDSRQRRKSRNRFKQPRRDNEEDKEKGFRWHLRFLLPNWKREKIQISFLGETTKVQTEKFLVKAKLIGKKFSVSKDAVIETNLEQVESEILKTEIIFRKSILSKMIYTALNSNRFIESNPFTIQPKRERRRRPSPFAFENKPQTS